MLWCRPPGQYCATMVTQPFESEVLHYVRYSNHNSEATQGGAHSPEVLAETRKHLELAALLPRRPGLSACAQPCL